MGSDRDGDDKNRQEDDSHYDSHHHSDEGRSQPPGDKRDGNDDIYTQRMSRGWGNRERRLATSHMKQAQMTSIVVWALGMFFIVHIFFFIQLTLFSVYSF